ncbi:cilia- and flagella-associated protein 90 [Pithys albifrons albifrons]|uniref:cilia- and flagella-associated protein 90 n=1 Tax=Pithys albifrons albifrons TaxID=3385563 RepID=UPI003A5CD279
MAGPGPGPGPGAGGLRGVQEAFSTAAGSRRLALAAFSPFSYIPTGREGPPELSYFNRAAKTEQVFTYDTIFRIPEGYNQYLPRCDRSHAKGRGLHINKEEMARPVPVLSSSEYGRCVNQPLEKPTKDHVRANHLQEAIYGEKRRTCLQEKPSPSLDPC